MSDDKAQKNIAKLEKLLALGKRKYILYYGVLGWGLVSAILVSVIDYFIDRDFPKYFHFITFPLMGIFWGWFMWIVINRQYKKLKAKG